MKLTTKNFGYQNSWKIGSCQSDVTYGNNAEYIEQCCLPDGLYNLECKFTRNHWAEVGGWNGGYIQVDGQKYCDSFRKGNVYNSPKKINVVGNGKYFSYFASILSSY